MFFKLDLFFVFLSLSLASVFLTFSGTVHVRQLLESGSPSVEVIEILLIVICAGREGAHGTGRAAATLVRVIAQVVEGRSVRVVVRLVQMSADEVADVIRVDTQWH